jgi:hypothetical protein
VGARIRIGPFFPMVGYRMSLRHIVFFWLKNPEVPADRDSLVAGLSTLAEIPGIRDMHIGYPAATEERGVIDASYDVSEIMTFDNVEDQNSYQVHPVHQAFIRDYGHLWDRVVVYDSLDMPAA